MKIGSKASSSNQRSKILKQSAERKNTFCVCGGTNGQMKKHRASSAMSEHLTWIIAFRIGSAHLVCGMLSASVGEKKPATED